MEESNPHEENSNHLNNSNGFAKANQAHDATASDGPADTLSPNSQQDQTENHSLERAKLLFGQDGLDTLQNCTVVVAGCGGVGSFAIESLARSGVGKLVLIDKDVVEASNLNRQLCALNSTVGKAKTEILKERIADIRPETEVVAYTGWYDKDLNDWVLSQKPDYILDCIDSMRSKQDLISFALEHKIPVLSSMGMARRKDPTKIEIMELEKTTNDPMAKVMRNWKRKNKIRQKIMTVCSTELPIAMEPGKSLPSAIFVPATAGLTMGGKCVQDLMNRKKTAPKAGPDTDLDVCAANQAALDPTKGVC